MHVDEFISVYVQRVTYRQRQELIARRTVLRSSPRGGGGDGRGGRLQVFKSVRRQQQAGWPKQGCLLVARRLVLKKNVSRENHVSE